MLDINVANVITIGIIALLAFSVYGMITHKKIEPVSK